MIKKITLIVVVGTTAFINIAKAQKTNGIVKAEKAFAALAFKTDIKTSFEKNLDTSGLIVSGNKFVNGLKAYAKATVDTTELLAWYPTYACINANDDLGFTSGPYQYHANRKEKPVVAGYYFSIWKKDAQNNFKLLFDGGVNHKDLKYNVYGAYAKKSIINKVLKSSQQSLSPKTLAINFESKINENNADLYKNYLAVDGLVLRPNHEMIIGIKQYLELLPTLSEHKFSYLTKGSNYDEKSGFYYQYGNLMSLTPKSENEKPKGYYIRVWSQAKDGWKIIADVMQY